MLEALFTPKAVAVIGASRTEGKVGHDLVKNLIGGGYEGAIVPVNPSADTILELKCYDSLKAYGKPIDLALIAVPVPAVMDALKSAVRAKAGAVAVITAGFKESGGEGIEIEKQMAAFCRSEGVRLLGPNCLGLINTENRMNASFAGAMPKPGGISVISQSGALCTAILDLAVFRGLGLGKLVSIGNKADISEVDLLSALARDEQTRVIVGYLENFSSGDDFVKAAEEASRRKPVVILKAGTTAAGMKAASSHTGVLAGGDIAYGAAFTRAGVIRADTFNQLFDYAAAFSMQPLPRGNRTLIITNAGGPGTMTADAAEHAGLEVATLNSNTATALRSKLPHAASTGNPIDVLGDADPERYSVAIQAAQDDPSADGVIVILTPQAMTRPAETARAIAGKLKGDKPVLSVFMGGRDVMPGRDELSSLGLPDYDSPDRAVAALKAMHDYSAWKRRPPRAITKFRVNRRRVERILSRHLRSGILQIGEVKAKDILHAYGFHVPTGYFASNAQESVEAAEQIGFPVAMKIVSREIVHKSDVGGVRLNLVSADAVRDAFDLMVLRTGQRLPEATVDGVYVEKMMAGGREMIIGMSRDAQFGPMLMFGLGGIFVEVMKDVAFHLAPITADEALQMLQSTRSYKMLEGTRGQRGIDIHAVAVGLQRISQLATDFPQLDELDINPFIVGDVGTEPVVADARMTLRPPPEKPS